MPTGSRAPVLRLVSPAARVVLNVVERRGGGPPPGGDRRTELCRLFDRKARETRYEAEKISLVVLTMAVEELTFHITIDPDVWIEAYGFTSPGRKRSVILFR